MKTRTELAAIWPSTSAVARKAGHTPRNPHRAIHAKPGTDAQTTSARATLEYEEAAEALLTVLAGILAMSPSATLAAAEGSEDLQEFIRRMFRGNDVEGTA